MKPYFLLSILLSATSLLAQKVKPAPSAQVTPEPAKKSSSALPTTQTPAVKPALPASVPAKLLPSAPLPATPVSFFKDKALEAAVRKQVYAKRDNQEVLTAEDVDNLSIIEAKGAKITDLSGLEKCKELSSLTLTDNKITRLEALQGLGRLQFLDLANNQITDLSPLAKCTALQYIELTNNKVTDVSLFGSIPAITSLYLAGNQITDITALFKLPKLWTLYLDGNKVGRLQGIGELKWLSMLSLKENQVSDLTPLEPLNDLQFLFLDKNPVTDLMPLHRMWMKDNAGAKEWAPYCQIFLPGCPLSEASQAMVAELKKAGARISP
jgi:Leucine-rich repeat (LRR) protein